MYLPLVTTVIVEPLSAFLIMTSCILSLSDWTALLSPGVRLLDVWKLGVEHVVWRASTVSSKYFSSVLLLDVVGV